MTDFFPVPDAAPESAPEPSLAGYPPPAPWTRLPERRPGEQLPDGRAWQLPFPPIATAMPPRPPKLDARPDGPREYQQMLRGPRYQWWRPLLALILVAAIGVPLILLAFFPVVLASALAGVPNAFRYAARASFDVDNLGPAGFLYVNLSLIVLIPTAGLSIWIAHRRRWLLRCVVIVLPVWALYLGASLVFDPPQGARPAHWGLLLVMVVCLTPFQAAGEEFLFRGWIMQNVGSWFRNPTVGLVVGLAVSVTAFSAAHGSPDIWVLGSLGIFALTAGLATWRTGGLEAGIAIHAVNNIGVFVSVILVGGWQQAFVGADSTSTPLAFGIDLLVHAVVLSLIFWQAKKTGLERRYLPPIGQLEPAPTPYAPALTT